MMKRLAILGGVLMLAAWVPFIYAELTSAPAEKKAREVFADAKEQAVLAAAGASGEPEKPPETVPVHVATPDAPAKPATVEPTPAPVQAHAPAAPPDAAVRAEPGAPAAEAAEAEPPSPSGQIEALKRAYETQPRDALWATDAETHIHGMFGGKEVPGDMLKNASCRRAVCRVQLNWSNEIAPALVALNQRIAQEFGPEIAIAPIASHEGEEVHQVDLYLTRKGFTVADQAK